MDATLELLSQVLVQALNPVDDRKDDEYVTKVEAEPNVPETVQKDYYSDNRIHVNTQYNFSVPADQKGM